jgi:L-serine dehydratase
MFRFLQVPRFLLKILDFWGVIGQNSAMHASIFNDVIGPVMRGPSSSHCAAALRIGRLARDLMRGDLQEVLIEFDRQGSLATTHETQGSDMGLFGGLMGWEATDDRLPEAGLALAAQGITIRMEIGDFGLTHPNTYRLILSNAHERHVLTAVSLGGGMVRVVDIDDFRLCIEGDYWETLIYADQDGPAITEYLKAMSAADQVLSHEAGDRHLIEIKTGQYLDSVRLSQLQAKFNGLVVRQLTPVLPVLSHKDQTVPFSTCAQMLAFNKDRHWPLWQLARTYESARGNLTEAEVLERMTEIVGILRASVKQGLQGTDYADRILGYQCGRFSQQMQDQRLLEAGSLNRIILYVTALMEVKSAMGIIVAAPTAGACAALPGACLGIGDDLGCTDEAVVQALLAGAMIGIFIATRSTFAAEVAGCQAECGAASGMAAAALVTMGGGTAEQAVAAASMALQNSLGMVCDPVANRVEVPCLGKNVMAASNALACANMALADFDPVVPLDEVIEAMDEVGRSIPCALRCTALGGLSTTETSQAIMTQMEQDKTE